MLIAAQVAFALIIALAYALRVWSLARSGRRMHAFRIVCVAAGVAMLIVAVVTLWGPGGELLYWRTSEHLLIGDLAGLLIAVGLTAAVLEPLAHTPLRRLNVLCEPRVALSLWVLGVLVWQWPSIYDATLRHSTLAVLQNMLLVLLGINMWAALLRETPWRALQSSGARIAYLLLTRLPLVALACIAVWSPEVHYPYYLSRDTASSLSPLADQGIAGAIVLTETALLTIGLLLWMRAKVGRPAAHAARAGLASVEETQAGVSPLAMDAQA